MAVAFTCFPDLPVEAQLRIWDLVLQDFTFVRAERGIKPYSGATAAALWPLAAIPRLGEADAPGLIPCPLPAGMPATLASHPLPGGMPNPQGPAVDFDTYTEMMMRCSRRLVSNPAPGVIYHFRRAWDALLETEGGGGGGGGGSIAAAEELPEEKRDILGLAGYDDAWACFSVCRISLQEAMRRTIVDTGQPLQEPGSLRGEAGAGAGGDRFYPVRNGVDFGDVFRDRRSGRPFLVYAIAPNTTDPSRPPVIGRDFRPGAGGYVAARLADIERCILGQRLSLAARPPPPPPLSPGADTEAGTEPRRRRVRTLDADRFGELERAHVVPAGAGRAGAAARGQPPVPLPTGVDPVDLLHAPAPPPPPRPEGRTDDDYGDLGNCLSGVLDGVFGGGDWYFDLVETGACTTCRRPLLDELRRRFPDLLDPEACLDVVVLRDRAGVEEPEATVTSRTHEIFV